jgi:hypothetical protein
MHGFQKDAWSSGRMHLSVPYVTYYSIGNLEADKQGVFIASLVV